MWSAACFLSHTWPAAVEKHEGDCQNVRFRKLQIGVIRPSQADKFQNLSVLHIVGM